MANSWVGRRQNKQSSKASSRRTRTVKLVKRWHSRQLNQNKKKKKQGVSANTIAAKNMQNRLKKPV